MLLLTGCRRAFETFDAFEGLGVAPDADTYNALMHGCIEGGQVDTALKVFDRMLAAGVDANACTHHQLVDACVVAGGPFASLFMSAGLPLLLLLPASFAPCAWCVPGSHCIAAAATALPSRAVQGTPPAC